MYCIFFFFWLTIWLWLPLQGRRLPATVADVLLHPRHTSFTTDRPTLQRLYHPPCSLIISLVIFQCNSQLPPCSQPALRYRCPEGRFVTDAASGSTGGQKTLPEMRPVPFLAFKEWRSSTGQDGTGHTCACTTAAVVCRKQILDPQAAAELDTSSLTTYVQLNAITAIRKALYCLRMSVMDLAYTDSDLWLLGECIERK